MKPRTLLVLTVVVAALAAFVWFYERKLPSSEEAKEQEKKLLAGVETDEVREVTIARDGQTVRLVREGKPAAKDDGDGEDDEESDPSALPTPVEWRLAAPLQARADRSAVEGLLSSLLGLDKARTLEKVDRKQYGLEPPAAKVTLVTDDGTQTIEVGRELPGLDQRAVALAGEAAVHAVASSFWSDLTKPPGDWRSRELFPGSRDDVERVSLQQAGGRVLLAKRGEEPWLEAPLADRADQERFDQLLDAVTGLQAAEFVDEPPGPPASLGLEPPQAVVEIVRKGQSRPFRLALGASETTSTPAPAPATPETPESDAEPAPRYARADGQLVTLQSAQLDEALARSPQDWRSRSWSPFAVYEVDKVELADGKGKLVLTRDEGDWKRGEVKIFYGPVSDFLGAVADAKAERVVDPEAAGGLTGGPPAMTITLTGSGGKKQTLTLWPGRVEGPAGAGAPAKSSGRDATLMMGAGLPGDLAEKLAAIRKAEPLKETPTPTPEP